jgi:hypothetical protein
VNKPLALLIASTFSLTSLLAFADDRTSSNVSPEEQAKMKQEADAKKSATAKMTPEEKKAAKKAKDAERQKMQDATIKMTQNPGESRNMGINKSAAASKAGPTPQRDYINTPDAEAKMYKQKGQ